MSEWRDYKLGDIADVKGGKRLPKGELLISEKTPHPYIRITDFDGYKINLSAIQYVKESVQKSISRYTVNKQDIILSIVGTIGLCAKVPDELDNANLTENCVKLVIDKAKIDNDYLYYHLINPDTQDLIGGLDVGSTQPKLPIYNVQKIAITLPPLEEQKAIAEVLSSFDDKIDLLHRQNKILEELAKTLFRQWFIEEAADDWAVVTVGDFVKTNSSSIKKDCTLSTIQYLDTSSLTEGKIDTLQLLDLADAPSRARRIVKHNDVLISTVRPNQKHYGIMKNPTEDIIVSTGFCVISCEKINPHFIYMLLTTDDMTEYLHSIAEGSTSTYPSLKPSDIEAVEFLLPQEEKLKVFSDYADNAWNKIDSNYRQMKTLEHMRDTLLPKLMSGEIRLKDI